MIRLLWWLVAILAMTSRPRRTSFPFPSEPLPESPVTDTNHDTATEHGPEVTDLVKIGDNPIIDTHTTVDTIDVIVNIGLARAPQGHHAIKVMIPQNATITATQAHHLHVDLEVASRVVSDVRRDAGYTS